MQRGKIKACDYYIIFIMSLALSGAVDTAMINRSQVKVCKLIFNAAGATVMQAHETGLRDNVSCRVFCQVATCRILDVSAK